MKRIVEKIKSGRILVSDGAWGTFLQAKGLAPGECPELWNIVNRDEVLDIAKRYVAAGADMIETNSFGGTRCKFEHFGLASRVREINKAAAEISRQAAGPDRHVIASVGPTGKMLVTGDVTEEQLYEAFAEQMSALEEGGADALCIETMSDIAEANCAIRAAKENTKCEIICTYTFEKTVQNEYRTMMGVGPEAAATATREAGAHIMGANCGNGCERMIDITKLMHATVKDLPVLIHANAGQPKVVDGATIFPDTAKDMAKCVNALITAGTRIIGGCCGTTPEHIRAIKAAVEMNRELE